MCFCLLESSLVCINAKTLTRYIHCGWMCLQLLHSGCICFENTVLVGYVCVCLYNHGLVFKYWKCKFVVFVFLFLFLIISPVVELSVSLSRPYSHGLHHLSLVPPAHALWQHLIHGRVCHPAGLASFHSSRGSRRNLLVFRLRYREGINISITRVVIEPHKLFSLHLLKLHWCKFYHLFPNLCSQKSW